MTEAAETIMRYAPVVDLENQLTDMTKDERSLLLFFETAATDYGGLVDPRHMNAEDWKIARKERGQMISRQT